MGERGCGGGNGRGQAYSEASLKLHTTSSIIKSVEDLRDRRPAMKTGDFEELERSRGFSYSPGSVLLEPRLRSIVDPANQTIYDWPHSVLKGVVPVHIARTV